jgi:flagellar basal body rod protein FlgG
MLSTTAMQVGMYTGAASMAAYEKWQEAISQNISEGSLPGFKKTEISFSAMDGGSTSVGSNATNSDSVRGSMPAATPSISFAQGQLSHSESDLDFAIQGKGFFQVQQPNGQMAYTRDGQFHLSPDKTLVTSSGMTVQGDGGPITFKTGGGPIAINADGMITQQDQPVAKLPAYDFSDPTKLRRVGDGLLAPDGSGEAAQKIDRPQILNNYLENSNVTPMTEMVNLVSVSRAYEASQKVVQTADDNQDKAIQILGNTSS